MIKHTRISAFLTGPVLLLLMLLAIPAVSCAQSGNAIDDLNANGVVYTLAVQADGKTLVGGDFTSIAGQTRNRIARLNADGSLDVGFAAPVVNAAVRAIAAQADGHIWIGGDFSDVGGRSLYGLAHLNADGSLNEIQWNQVTEGVYALALQPDGKLVVGSDEYVHDYGGTCCIYRQTPRGDIDLDFLVTDGAIGPSPGDIEYPKVYALALQPDGKIVVGGNFREVDYSSGSPTDPHYGLVRLNADGSRDMSFFNHDDQHGDLSGIVYAIALQPDGKLVLGGRFDYYLPSEGGAGHQNILRLNADGGLDVAFKTIVQDNEATVHALALQADGKLVLGGDFTALSLYGSGVIARNNIARVNADGSFDTAFNPNASGPVTSLALQADGKLMVGGEFTSLSPNGGFAIARHHIARLNADGSVYHDSLFTNGFEASLFKNRADFVAATASFFENHFDDVYTGASSARNYSQGGFTYTVDTTPKGHLYTGAGIIATAFPSDSITVTFTGAPVTAVGGNFWATDASFQPTGTGIVITLSNGTTETFTSTGPSDFRGFVTRYAINSISIDAPLGHYPTMDNLIVGKAK